MDHSLVRCLRLNNKWFIDSDSEWNLVPFSLLKLLLNVVWLFLVFCDLESLSGNIGNFLDDCVVNLLKSFVWDNNVFLIWDLVVNSVWNFFSDYIWNFVDHFVWFSFLSHIWNLDFDLIWDLSLNSVGDFSRNFNWLEGLHFVKLGFKICCGNLIWDTLCLNSWHFLCNLVFFSHIIGDIVNICVIRGIRSHIYIAIFDLCPVTTFGLSLPCCTSLSTCYTTKNLGSSNISTNSFFRFHSISRIVRLLTSNSSRNWNISGSCLVLYSISDFLFISVCSLVCDDWYFSSLNGSNRHIFSLVNCIISGLRLGPVQDFLLSSVIGLKDSVISCLSFFSVQDSVRV